MGAATTGHGPRATGSARLEHGLFCAPFLAGIAGGKPIIRGRRLAVEHVLGMLSAGDSFDDLLREYPWLEREDITACLIYARRLVGHERVEPAVQSSGV